MKYTVVVKEIIDGNGNFNKIRFNNVKSKIVKFLLKYNFSFMVSIADNTVNKESAKNYIEIFLKETHIIVGREKAIKNAWLNYNLLKKLGGNPNPPTYTRFI